MKSTDKLWDYGLSVGSDGERCYLQEAESSSQRTPTIVYELPARYAAMFATFRPQLEAQWARRALVLRWPAGWHPAVGAEVMLRTGARVRRAKIIRQRPGELQLVVGRDVDTWRSPRQVAPIPAPGVPPTSGAYLCSTEDERICVDLVPAREVDLPIVALREADVGGRMLLVNDLLVELGGIHTRRIGKHKLVWVRPDGTPLLEARFDVAFTKEHDSDTYATGWSAGSEWALPRPAGWAHADRSIAPADLRGVLEALATATRPFSYERVGDDLVFVYEPRLVLPVDDKPLAQLGAAARRTLSDLATW